MNENLLDKVSTEKVEALINESQLVRFRDKAYYTCISLYYSIFEALKRRVNVIQGE